ncbi:MarR family transcriptional regulator [Clostridium sp. JN-1]|uniref:MarR family winged helix-turn-helix transcriptional regulator n=1 Tax=Clostridium sp. JN-1 TaxID=2483110 RepID=UPI000F0BD3A1|nr:MarR family transcriptional regulator [Clostridium sp. JN-1]
MNQYYIQQVFATIFYLSNKVQVEGDKLDERITVRQWMVLLTILHLPENEAFYSNVAEKMGCSKQNVKHIVVNLEKKNYVTLEENKKDKRSVNIKITKDCMKIIKEYYEKGNELMSTIFRDFDEEELETLWKLLNKLAAYDGSNWTGYGERVDIDRK